MMKTFFKQSSLFAGARYTFQSNCGAAKRRVVIAREYSSPTGKMRTSDMPVANCVATVNHRQAIAAIEMASDWQNADASPAVLTCLVKSSIHERSLDDNRSITQSSAARTNSERAMPWSNSPASN
jgi:hypothetical protein